jgi:hypothetical protein
MILAELPARSDWYFGGFLYGLEPLTLPDPRVFDEPGHPGRAPQDWTTVRERILRPGGQIRQATDDEAVTTLFWFRWKTGHQLSFALWRLMSQTLYDLQAGRLARQAALDSLTCYVRGYCAMLLYTSSCSRKIYQDLIRPSMYLQHPGFSGGWAPDYRPVRDVFRAKKWVAESPELARAVDLYRDVHEGVAAKLVPGGRSLLQASGPARRADEVSLPDTRSLGVLYDNYFMTLRAPVSRPNVVSQLLRRLIAVSQDVSANGLYPSTVTGADDKPEELRADSVLACEAGFTGINLAVAGEAIGRPAGSLRAVGE